MLSSLILLYLSWYEIGVGVDAIEISPKIPENLPKIPENAASLTQAEALKCLEDEKCWRTYIKVNKLFKATNS